MEENTDGCFSDKFMDWTQCSQPKNNTVKYCKCSVSWGNKFFPQYIRRNLAVFVRLKVAEYNKVPEIYSSRKLSRAASLANTIAKSYFQHQPKKQLTTREHVNLPEQQRQLWGVSTFEFLCMPSCGCVGNTRSVKGSFFRKPKTQRQKRNQLACVWSNICYKC